MAALKIYPRWPDAYFGLARDFYGIQNYEAVIHWCDIGRSLPEPDTLTVRSPLDTSYTWIIYYAVSLALSGRNDEALEWTDRALLMCPDDAAHLRNRAAILETMGAAA